MSRVSNLNFYCETIFRSTKVGLHRGSFQNGMAKSTSLHTPSEIQATQELEVHTMQTAKRVKRRGAEDAEGDFHRGRIVVLLRR